MEKTTVMLFWGSLLAQYIWIQRQSLYNGTKNLVRETAKAIWERSIKKIKSLATKKTVAFQQKQGQQPVNSEPNSNIMKEDKEPKISINKQKKIKKQKLKKPRNLKKALKRYEDWFLESRNIRKMAKRIENADGGSQQCSLQLKRESYDFNDNMANYNVEQLYEEYCQQLEEQSCNGNILGYNPIVSDDQNTPASNIYNSGLNKRQ